MTRLFAILAATLALLLAGCSRGDAVELAEWTLVAPGRAPEAVRLPLHVDDRLPESASRYSLTTEIALVPSLAGPALTLVIAQLPARVSLLVDGEQVRELDPFLHDGYRAMGPHRWPIAPKSGATKLTVELRVERTYTRAAWLDTVPRISATPNGDDAFLALRALDDTFTTGAIAAMCITGFAYLLVFVFSRRAEYGWLALQGGLVCVFPLYTRGITQSFFGTRDGAVMAACLSLGVVVSVYFSHASFAVGPVPRVWRPAPFGIGLVSAFASGPFTATRVLAPMVAVVVAGRLAHEVWIERKMRGMGVRPRMQRLFGIAWICIGAFGWTDLSPWLGFGEPFGGLHFACLGITLAGLLVSAALSREHIALISGTDRLNAELADRVAALEGKHQEVEQLNVELRRQIAERSRALADVLARASSSSGASRALPEGTEIGGRYRVVGALGKGAMGAVYEVERMTDQRHFALKVVSHGGPSALARFAREAQALAGVKHENVVGIVDVDVEASGVAYLVMELVRGQSLDRTEKKGRDWSRAVLAQIAAGLAEVHARGVVHRDLKPSNVLVEEAADGTPRAKIADFGIASLEDAPLEVAATAAADDQGLLAPALTRTGAILGTPLYMAPELARGGRDATAASDIWCFGVLAHELLFGAYPFAEPPALSALRGNSIAPPPAIDPEILGPDVARAIGRCFAIEPFARPSARELCDLLTAA